MLKINVDEHKIEANIMGTLPTICSDLTNVLSTVNKRLQENDPRIGHAFRVMFTKGFMDGICFNDDREHMNHYLAEGDDCYSESSQKYQELRKAINDLNEAMSKRAELQKELEDLIKELGENEAE